MGGVVTTLLYMIKRVQYLQIDILSFFYCSQGVWQAENDSSESKQGNFATVSRHILPSESQITNPISDRD